MPGIVVWCLLTAYMQVFTQTVVIGQEYYVTPALPPSPDCSEFEYCHTLEYYAVNSANFFVNKTNVFLIFFDGTHNLTQKLDSKNIAFFYMKTFNSQTDNVSIAVFIGGLSFTSVNSLIITGIKVVGSSELEKMCFYLLNIQHFQALGLSLSNCSLSVNTSILENGMTIELTLAESEFQHAELRIGSDGSKVQSQIFNMTLLDSVFLFSPISLYVEEVNLTISLLNAKVELGSGINLTFVHSRQQPTIAIISIQNGHISDSPLKVDVLPKSSVSVSDRMMSGFWIDLVRTDIIGSIFILNGAPGFRLNCNTTENKLINSSKAALYIGGWEAANCVLTSCLILGNRGSGIVISQSYYETVLIVKNSTLNNNYHGLLSQSGKAYITFSDSTLDNNHHSGIIVSTNSPNHPTTVNIINCSVRNNLQVGVNIQPYYRTLEVNITDSVISYNRKPFGHYKDDASRGTCAAALMIVCSKNDDDSVITIANCTFEGNEDSALEPKIVQVIHCSKLYLDSHSQFIHNNGTALEAYKSQVIVLGHVTFSNNSAYRGGGLALIYSTVLLERNSLLEFEGNRVSDVGGAIYYPLISEDKDEFCFYQLNISEPNEAKELNATVRFSGNVASNGGELIFGAALNDECEISDHSHISSSSVYQFIFSNDTNSSGMSSFSSEPTRVCFCKGGVPQCMEKSFILSHLDQPVFPGEMITLSAVIVGKDFGTASGSIYATFIHSSDNIVGLQPSQYSQVVNYSNCNELEYTILSLPNKSVTLVFTASVASTQFMLTDSYVKFLISQYKSHSTDKLLDIPIYATMFVDDCPLGFSLSSHQQPVCTCTDMLTEVGIGNCTIVNHTGLIERSGSVWVGLINGQLSAHRYCPYRYCKADTISVDLNNSQSQCSSNRAGVLCGKCEDNYSLPLGSSSCIKCSDSRYVTLIIPILFGTVFLVLLIKVLDLTVANGMINGVIFYANIMWANKSTLLSADSHSLYYSHLYHTSATSMVEPGVWI